MDCESANGPRPYEIRIRGTLPNAFVDRLGAMQVVQSEPPHVLVLQGMVQDQAELSGILNTLHELHLSLVSVRELEETQG